MMAFRVKETEILSRLWSSKVNEEIFSALFAMHPTSLYICEPCIGRLQKDKDNIIRKNRGEKYR